MAFLFSENEKAKVLIIFYKGDTTRRHTNKRKSGLAGKRQQCQNPTKKNIVNIEQNNWNL